MKCTCLIETKNRDDCPIHMNGGTFREPGISKTRRNRLQDKLNEVAPETHLRCIANEDIRCGQLFFVDPKTGKAALTKEKTR